MYLKTSPTQPANLLKPTLICRKLSAGSTAGTAVSRINVKQVRIPVLADYFEQVSVKFVISALIISSRHSHVTYWMVAPLMKNQVAFVERTLTYKCKN